MALDRRTDHYIVYGFAVIEGFSLAVRAGVRINDVVSVLADRIHWIEVANWGDISDGVRIQTIGVNRTDVDVVLAEGCTNIGYFRISNKDNMGDYGGAIESFTTMKALAKVEALVAPGETLILAAESNW